MSLFEEERNIHKSNLHAKSFQILAIFSQPFGVALLTTSSTAIFKNPALLSFLIYFVFIETPLCQFRFSFYFHLIQLKIINLLVKINSWTILDLWATKTSELFQIKGKKMEFFLFQRSFFIATRELCRRLGNSCSFSRKST